MWGGVRQSKAEKQGKDKQEWNKRIIMQKLQKRVRRGYDQNETAISNLIVYDRLDPAVNPWRPKVDQQIADDP